MNIGEAAERSGLPAKTIRYYEDIGLVTPLRDANGYRAFRESDTHKLTFLGRARALGFTIEDCRNLLALWEDTSRASSDVRAIAKGHLREIEERGGRVWVVDLDGPLLLAADRDHPLKYDTAGVHPPDAALWG